MSRDGRRSFHVAGDFDVTVAESSVRPADSNIFTPDVDVFTIFESGHGWTTSGADAASDVNDTSVFARGSQSAKVVTQSNATAAFLQRTSGFTLDLTRKQLRVVVRVSDIGNLSAFALRVGNSALTSYYQWGNLNANYLREDDWAILTLNFGDASIVGTPDRAQIEGMTFRIQATNGNQSTVWVNGVEVIPEPFNVWPVGVVSITFDDSYANVYTNARPRMDLYGFRGTLYTIASAIDTASRLSLAQLIELHENGWEVASHAYSQTVHDTGHESLTLAEVESDIRLLKRWLTANGFGTADHIAYPLGAFSAGSLDLLRKFYETGRTIIDEVKETFPPGDAMRLHAQSSISGHAGGTGVAAVQALIDEAYANRQWLILSFHQIVTGATANTTEITQTDFNTIIDYLDSVGIPVRPIGEVMRAQRPPERMASIPAMGRFRTGLYYTGFGIAGDGTAAPAQNTMRVMPIIIDRRTTFDRIGLEVTTLAANSTVRLGIYDDGGDAYPRARLLDAGTIDSTTTGFKEITIDLTLNPGLYWLAAVSQGGAPTIRTKGAAVPFVGLTAGTSGSQTGYEQTGVSGALPAVFSTTVTTHAAGPKVMLRAA